MFIKRIKGPPMIRVFLSSIAVATLLGMAAQAHAQDAPRVEFTRLVAHWAEYGTPII